MATINAFLLSRQHFLTNAPHSSRNQLPHIVSKPRLVLPDPDIYRLVTFHVPNAMSIFVAYIIPKGQSKSKAFLLFHNIPSFYGKEVLAVYPNPKLENHPLSAVRECLFNTFSATLHIWRPSPSITWGCHVVLTKTYSSQYNTMKWFITSNYLAKVLHARLLSPTKPQSSPTQTLQLTILSVGKNTNTQNKTICVLRQGQDIM